jgi:hypothetical protein
MKIIKSLFAFATLFALQSTAAESITEKWPQIKAYHEVMSKSYHSSEEGNLNPIRNNAKLLLDKSEALTVENMPNEFRSPKTIDALVTLKKQTKTVHDLVENKAKDEEVKNALSALHETFHKIVGLCGPQKK